MRHTLLIFMALAISASAFSQSKFKRVNGLPNEIVTTVAIHPENTGFAAGTQDGGLYIQYLANTYTINKETRDFPSDNIRDVAWQGDSLWVATDSGLMMLHGDSFSKMDWYNTAVIDIPSNNILAVHIGEYGGSAAVSVATYNKGIGTLINGFWFNNFVNLAPKSLPANYINDLITDDTGTIWVSTDGKGIAYSDDYATWDSYDTDNSELNGNSIRSIEIDEAGHMWFGVLNFISTLTKYDGDTWKTYGVDSAGLPGNVANDIKSFNDSILWLGIYGGGMVEFNTKTEKAGLHYTKDNSPLTSNFINEFDHDGMGTLWIATDDGLWMYNESGFIDNVPQPDYNLNVKVYPNPTNGSLINVLINDNTTTANIKVFDMTGKLVHTNILIGNTGILDLSKLARGVYNLVVETDNKQSTIKVVLS